MKCVMKDCTNEGEPHEGYKFSLCRECDEEIVRRVREKWFKRLRLYARHRNN